MDEAVKAGASGFLLKDARHEDLIAAVRAVHRGDAVLAPAVTRRVLALANAAVPTARGGSGAADRLAGLGEQEREVLLLVGTGLSNAAIAERLSVSEAGVKRRVSQLLTRLGCENRVQLAIAAIDGGLVPRA
ncbi:LuxR C-terminal-related transcriptional regulator [Nonomuraea sp. NPDC059194]|uniref:LuxR C-terminal-related transcriptional regulator n=1 Tax=Nonomuraea sp. NPDC059194 TaxID=3346764 RepID=UPI0036ADE8B6